MAVVTITFTDNDEDDTVGIVVDFAPEVETDAPLTGAQHVALSCLHRAKNMGEGDVDG